MRLTITTPGAVVVDHADVGAVRAEDESGAFGVLPHHADLVTALEPSVVAWRHADGRQGFCAVRGGLLVVSDGQAVSVATREAVVGDDLGALEALVTGRLEADAEAERRARAHAEQLRIQAIRQIIGVMRPGGGPS
ncbi:MAG TPA: F0F1 ATP synthase subunit epsilon [Caulobacteraceae bacterium]|nr:F0F1 ATP synthase subunit epsilon [Caulobacteraceae bacterium]